MAIRTKMGAINPAWLQRLRHKRGFGVHSPFAFRFITEVLNAPRGYKFYSEVQCAGSDRRILARLQGRFAPKNTVYIGKRAIALAPKEVKHENANLAAADFVVIDLRTADVNQELIERISKGELLVYAFNHNKGRIERLISAMPCGMSFRNSRSRAVLVVHSNLPRQDFLVSY